MRRQEIDAAIFAHTNTSWTKVALIALAVADESGVSFSGDEDDFQIVAQHIEQLVSEGRLLAQGNLQDWRHSEIRKP